MNPLPVSLPAHTGVVFLIHGTRNQRAQGVIHESMTRMVKQYADTLGCEYDRVRYSFLEMMDPSLTTVLTELCQQGRTHIRIIPLLLFPGAHLYEDIPEISEAVMSQFPGVSITTSAHIGVEEPEFIQILLKRLTEQPAVLAV